VALATAVSFGQGAYKAPRGADGHADISGIWQVLGVGPSVSIEARTPSLGMPASLGVIVDPADGRIPYKPEARAKQQSNEKDRAKLDPVNRCFLPGVPRLMLMPFPMQIVQTPGVVIVLSEYAHTTRNLFMTGEHLDGIDFWMGDSRGKWDGDTLVVDATDFNDMTWLDQAGNHHSGDMHVVERFTRTGPDTLQYEATITDAKTYTRPWTIRAILYKHLEPNFRLLEYDCNAYMEFEGAK
jgi:hypothetical protein